MIKGILSNKLKKKKNEFSCRWITEWNYNRCYDEWIFFDTIIIGWKPINTGNVV